MLFLFLFLVTSIKQQNIALVHWTSFTPILTGICFSFQVELVQPWTMIWTTTAILGASFIVSLSVTVILHFIFHEQLDTSNRRILPYHEDLRNSWLLDMSRPRWDRVPVLWSWGNPNWFLASQSLSWYCLTLGTSSRRVNVYCSHVSWRKMYTLQFLNANCSFILALIDV